MQSDNKLIADFVKLANSAAGTFAGMTREARESARERLRETMGGEDFVSRDEFEAVKAMAANARAEADRLAERVAALETIHHGSRTAEGTVQAQAQGGDDSAPPAA